LVTFDTDVLVLFDAPPEADWYDELSILTLVEFEFELVASEVLELFWVAVGVRGVAEGVGAGDFEADGEGVESDVVSEMVACLAGAGFDTSTTAASTTSAAPAVKAIFGRMILGLFCTCGPLQYAQL
jgi:hypothetical protein